MTLTHHSHRVSSPTLNPTPIDARSGGGGDGGPTLCGGGDDDPTPLPRGGGTHLRGDLLRAASHTTAHCKTLQNVYTVIINNTDHVYIYCFNLLVKHMKQA